MLEKRLAREPNFRLESEALGILAEVFSNAPDELGQRLAETALRLTGAHAAGISLEEEGASPRRFRWIATAGSYARYLDGTMPWDFSPCGEVVRANKPLLMRNAVALYEYIDQLHEPAHEVLLVPFHHRGRAIGTVWVVSHGDQLMFDREDLRIVQTLTRFAGAAVQNVGLVRRLSEENALSQQLDARKDRFLAVLAHEMRNPLSAISISAQLIMRLGDDESRRRVAIDSIERQTGQLSRLVSDITDVVAIRSGKVSLRLVPVAIQEVVARALESCASHLEAKRHRVDVEVPDRPLMVMSDLQRLTQVMGNLLNNAAKHTPEGGRIVIRAEAAGDETALSVVDSGIGLSPEAMASVFDMFMQVPMDDRPIDGGLGIGLALVKQIVELHAGSVTVASEGVGRGSTFTVRLPNRKH